MIGRVILVTLFSIIFLTPGQVALSVESLQESGSDPAGASITIQQSNEETLQFDISLTGVDVKGEFPTVDGLNHHISEPGAPALPYYSKLIALPPSATVNVTVEAQNTIQMPLAERVNPYPQPVGEADLTAGNIGPVDYVPSPEIYGTNAPYPTASFHVSEPMYLRDIRVVRLDIFPVRYNPMTNDLTYATHMDVALSFENANWNNLRPAPTAKDAYFTMIGDSILNTEQAKQWRSLPSESISDETVLPMGVDTFRIKVNEDGIYEITYADLLAAGMDVANVNPNTFEMIHRGEPIAYEFVGDTDNSFESDEAIRFFGWRYDGSRLERQFLADNENYYWLWAGGTATRINTITNPTGHPLAPSFPESTTYEEELLFTFSRMSWDTAPNEGDAWYTDGMRKLAGSDDREYRFDVNLINPAPAGADARIVGEITGRQDDAWLHEIEIYPDSYPEYSTYYNWIGLRNVNITTTVPITTLTNGNNRISFNILTTSNSTQAWYYLNRITIDYLRQFNAIDDQLLFNTTSGPHTFTISNYTVNNSNDVMVWDITNRLAPELIPITPGNISGTNPYDYTFGTNKTSGSFIATNSNAILSPLEIVEYVPTSLNPAGNVADWLAISHADFMAGVNTLATHRQNPTFGGHTTHIVDVYDVLQQYGYGYPTPAGMQAYLSYALSNWTQAPTYVTLVGDATSNPRGLECAITGFGYDCGNWGGDTETNFVPVDMLFVDRFAGWVISDYTNVLLAGDDNLPDMIIGRLPVQTTTELTYMTDKIITYEQNHLSAEPWQENLIFVADDADEAGDFCAGNNAMSAFIPDNFNETHLCLDNYATVEELATDMQNLVVNGDGVTFFNYRGHGDVTHWADENIMTSTSNFWTPDTGTSDAGKPVVILSLDCLDGDFARQGLPGLSEAILKLEEQGSLAHLSSTGLGLDWEHTQMQSSFYTALFDNGITTIGDAMNYAKINFVSHYSELYTLTLQGDPAMYLMRTELDVEKTALQPSGQPGGTVTYSLDVANNGIYPSTVVMTDTLPAGLTLSNVASTIPATTMVSGNDVIIEFQEDIAYSQPAQVTLVADIDTNYAGDSITNTVFAFGTGLESDLSNNSDAVTIPVGLFFEIFLPILHDK